MSSDEFDGLDPRDLASYFSAWKTRVQREDYRAATIVCSIVNLFRKEGSDPVEPADVFATLPKAPKGGSEEDLAAKILSVAASLGAEVSRES